MSDVEQQLDYYQALVEGGLTPNQARMYEVIVKHGRITASRTARLANVPRTLGYKALQELQKLELIEKNDAPGKVAVFFAAHPFKLKEIVNKRLDQTRLAKVAVDSVFSKLISDFNTRSGTPGLRVLEGIDGIAELYEDELNECQPIKLIRTPEDDTVPEIQRMVLKQIEEQIKLGISVRVIGPHNPRTEYQHDKDRLIDRRVLPPDMFAIPAQIAIYGNKVAITSYDPLITTLIENEPIRKTFDIIFEYLWKYSEQDHQRVMGTKDSE